jgi:hypothetical protein
MLICAITREQLLHFLPKGGEVAEIGVAEGLFSREILATAAPAKLHLIDLWQHQASNDYATDPNNVSNREHEKRYQGILDVFAGPIASGQIQVRRGSSVDTAAAFADGQLDWVYVDALHTYDGVLADLGAYLPKVKNDGFILGHDYTNHVIAEHMKFGVVDAVNAFVAKNSLAFVALTLEPYPTYVLARDTGLPAIQTLIAKLIYNVPGIVEIRDFPKGRGFVHRTVKLGEATRFLPSF